MSDCIEAVCILFDDFDGRYWELGEVLDEIVRCRDCQWFLDIDDSCGRVAPSAYDEGTGDEVIWLADAEPDGFCKWGKRKEARA